MIHIDSIAETVFVYRQLADIAVGNRENLLPLHITRLHVYSAMKMVRARFTEVACQHNLVIYWRNIFYIRIADRFGILTATCQQYDTTCKN